ncbi:hypothetical protein V3C10_04180 [[Clostridium] symbiosum]|uniref:hypothetical protein n=1 Tax=Clostridium symbiosum TaxID=1512 RepID=UPI001D07D34C|nr:hypothetical protein [[Clostridium] symbiosum]MCB6610219.1 hypothetical protein [[Clostridium] symbiosum]MCB6933554.1 hypothetical protein [[Clostridium] symbiosum]
MGSYIKIDRKILDWEWYSDINTCRLFLHMLLRANWKDGRFQGAEVPRGSFISSIRKLSEETGLTEREIRTAISHLKTTGEVTSESHTKYTVFTVKNYDCYQSTDTQNDNQMAGERQSNDNQTTTIEEVKKGRSIKKSISNKIPEKAVYADDTELNQAICDFIEYRRKIKAPMTEHAIKLLLKQLDKLAPGGEISVKTAILEQSIVQGWKGVFPLKVDKSTGKEPPKNRFHNLEEHGYDYDKIVWEMMNGENQGESETSDY